MNNVERKTKTGRLAKQLKLELLEKQLSSGTPVYSVNELALHYNVSYLTANKILNILVEEDFLYRKPYSGTYIKHNPPKAVKLGYAGYSAGPDCHDPIQKAGARTMYDYLAVQQINPQLISYQDLKNPDIAQKKLSSLDGILISSTYIDQYTIEVLSKFQKPIVVITNLYIEDRIPCSQIIPDITKALTEFSLKTDINRYSKIHIFSAENANALATVNNIRKVLKQSGIQDDKIKTTYFLTLNHDDPRFASSRFFSENKYDMKNELAIFTSGYFTQGMYDVLGNSDTAPDALSFDNLEKYMGIDKECCQFTAIDRCLEDVYVEGAKLLLRKIKENDEKEYIIYIPAKLVVRKSVRSLSAVQIN